MAHKTLSINHGATMETIVITFSAIITIIVTRKLLMLFPGQYFSIQDIVTTESNEINLVGFLLRFGTLFIISFVVDILYDGNLSTIIEYGIIVTFLLFWPFLLQTIIYSNKKAFWYEPKSRGYITKYIVVYCMYGFICVWICIATIPIYKSIKYQPTYLYDLFLSKYLTWDLFMQGLVTNFIAASIGGIFTLILTRAYKKLVKTK
jgi:hypothetical protein